MPTKKKAAKKVMPGPMVASRLVFDEWFWQTCTDEQAVTVLDLLIAAAIWGNQFEAMKREGPL